MRLGLLLRRGSEADDAASAETHACAFVMLDADPGAAFVAGAAVAVATRHVRIVVPVHLGSDHPVTLAEDLAVLDNLSNGRVVGLVDTGDLTIIQAAEDLALLRMSLSARPVRHHGERWQVPAGLEGHEAPESVHVTPKPVQIDLPLWLSGDVAVQLAADHARDLPVLTASVDGIDAAAPVQPAFLAIGGTEATLEADRVAVVALADAGATHLVLQAADPMVALAEVARYLIPEVAMTDFPRVVAEAMLPPDWPGPARYVAAGRDGEKEAR